LRTFPANVGRLEDALAAAEQVAGEFGRLDAVIPSLGGWWEGGPLTGVAAETWDAVMDEMLRTHFVFARAFLPVLQRQGGGRYIAIGGSAADAPIRNASLVCIAAAAQLMMTRALALENAASGIEILELVVDGPVRTRDCEDVAGPDWTTADEIGAVVRELVAHGRTSDALTTTAGPIVHMHRRRRAQKGAAS
jgi:3-oxoacyl-[acyl-carrier protein] reductase